MNKCDYSPGARGPSLTHARVGSERGSPAWELTQPGECPAQCHRFSPLRDRGCSAELVFGFGLFGVWFRFVFFLGETCAWDAALSTEAAPAVNSAEINAPKPVLSPGGHGWLFLLPGAAGLGEGRERVAFVI